MTDIFKSAEHQAHFNEYGFVLIDAHLEHKLDELELFIQSHITNLTDFYYSLIANGYGENKRIQAKVKEVLIPFYESFLNSYKSLNESFLVKPAHATSELLLHQDWCYTHESKFQSLTLWMPLCDVDENNGALFFVPGSHKWFNNLRSCGFSTARISSKDIPAEMLLKVPMRKGQVLLFHPAVFHGSYPNPTNDHRMVVTSVVLPIGADYVYFHALKDGEEKNAQIFSLDEDVFLRELKTIAVGAAPSTQAIEQFHYNHHALVPADLLTKSKVQLKDL